MRSIFEKEYDYDKIEERTKDACDNRAFVRTRLKRAGVDDPDFERDMKKYIEDPAPTFHTPSVITWNYVENYDGILLLKFFLFMYWISARIMGRVAITVAAISIPFDFLGEDGYIFAAITYLIVFAANVFFRVKNVKMPIRIASQVAALGGAFTLTYFVTHWAWYNGGISAVWYIFFGFIASEKIKYVQRPKENKLTISFGAYFLAGFILTYGIKEHLALFLPGIILTFIANVAKEIFCKHCQNQAVARGVFDGAQVACWLVFGLILNFVTDSVSLGYTPFIMAIVVGAAIMTVSIVVTRAFALDQIKKKN